MYDFLRGISKGYEGRIRKILTKFMAPAYTETERDALTNVEDSMIIYNTTSETFQGRAGGAWVDLH